MNTPERLWRFPTAEARQKLAGRFGLPNEPGMQDWEWQVADPERLYEFLAAYGSGELSDDERFTLMETILESFRGTGEVEDSSPRWQTTLDMIEQNVELHIHTICYWACLGSELEDAFEAAPFMRTILHRHRQQFNLTTEELT